MRVDGWKRMDVCVAVEYTANEEPMNSFDSDAVRNIRGGT